MSIRRGIALYYNGVNYPVSLDSPFTYRTALNQGIQWSAKVPYYIPGAIPYDAKFYLKIRIGSYIWTSPPLAALGRQRSKGRNHPDFTQLNGSDYYTFLLGEKAIDKPTYSKRFSDAVISDLSVTDALIYGAPRYYLFEYDAHGGKRIEHISRILRDGGYGYFVDTGGLQCIGLLDHALNGYGHKWVNNFSVDEDFTKHYTKVKFEKKFKVQTKFEQTFTDRGFKTVTFNTPLASVTCEDRSATGYIDEVAYFNGTNLQSAKQVGGVTLFNPDDYEGTNFPTGTGAPPINIATLNVFPPKYDDDLEELDARIYFEGIPYGSDYSNLDLNFSTYESTGEAPERCSEAFIDCICMPTLAHCNNIKKAITYDLLKDQKVYRIKGDEFLPFFKPGEGFYHPDIGTVRISSVSISEKETTLDCNPLVWW